jgi:hypothetical protein
MNAVIHQRGAIMALALLLLLALTLLGMHGIRGSLGLGQAMQAQLEQRLRFENAEIALREGESRLQMADGRPAEASPSTPVRAPFNDRLPTPEYRLQRLLSGQRRCPGHFYRVEAKARGRTSGLTHLQSIVYVETAGARPDCPSGRIAWSQRQ